MKIIYPKEDGSVALMLLFPKSQLTLLEAGRKYVPAGVPFNIVEDSDIPTDDTFFDAWEADFTNPDGYGGEI